MRSRGPVLLALAAVGVLVGVLANAFLAGGQGPPPSEAATLTETAGVLAEIETSPAATTPAPPPEEGFQLSYADGSGERVAKVKAVAYIAIDAGTGKILVARREHKTLPIASLTKVMTALLVIEDGKLGRKIRVERAATLVEPNKEGLLAGRWYQRRLLLFSALLVSANDSAEALAYAAGDGSIAAFYRRMNAKARQLGMTDTTYHSASGLDDEHNLSTAYDQALVARQALENPTFAKIVRTKRKVVDWPPPTYAKEWINHNRMLVSYPGTYGVKTGYTREAGACLIAAVRRDGHAVIAVILGSNAIWAEMPRLMDEAFARIDGAG
jgi:D-alanyl-D-alanine carboxypeptidase